MSATNVQLVKYSANGVTVELLGKPGMVTKYREDQCSLKEALIDDTVWANSSKGEVAAQADLAKLGCSGQALLELIMKKGKYSLTAQEKREIVEKLHNQVVNFIHENFIEPSSRTPHPVVRIENALKEVKYNLDTEKSAEANARAIIPKLMTIIRLEESIIEGQVAVPNAKLGPVVGLIYSFCTVRKEEYGPENAYFQVTITPGKFDDFNNQISKASGGQAVFSIAGAAASGEKVGEKENKKVIKKGGKGGHGGKGKK